MSVVISEAWIANKVLNGQEATISLALLERGISLEAPALKVIRSWALKVCDRLGCTCTIHVPSDVITFYPKSGP